MKIINLLVSLRREILEIVGAVEDANGGMGWDTTRPNSSTRIALKCVLEKHLQLGEKFGVYVVTRHSSCPNPAHKYGVVSRGHHGIKNSSDQTFIWTGEQLFQGDRYSICACSSSAKPTTHWVIDEIVVRKRGATKRHRIFANAIGDVQQAIDNAADNKPRSAIREYLLRAVLQLNDGILPQTVDDYIASRYQQSGNQVAGETIRR